MTTTALACATLPLATADHTPSNQPASATELLDDSGFAELMSTDETEADIAADEVDSEGEEPLSEALSTTAISRENRPDPMTGPHIKKGRSKNTFSYKNAIRESVLVKTSDSDYDGKRDGVRVDIIRPRELANKGRKVPVILLPSPYYKVIGRGQEKQKKEYDKSGEVTLNPGWYDNYFVQRGYAVALMDSVGTAKSEGCGDVGGPHDIHAVRSVIKWLNGKWPADRATYLVGGRGRADATAWSTGDVGIIGKSYDGGLANGTAATGVDGLRTVVSIGGISSWYNFRNTDGRRHSRRTSMSLETLSQLVSNDGEIPGKNCSDEHEKIYTQTPRELAGPTWLQRHYIRHAYKVKASALIAHGTQDFNVRMSNAGRLRENLEAEGIKTHMWLHHGAHDDPFDLHRKKWVRYVHRWMDHYLMGLDVKSVANREATIRRSPDKIYAKKSWPSGKLGSIILDPEGFHGGGSMITLQDEWASTDELVSNPKDQQGNRFVFLTEPVKKRVRLSGGYTLNARVKTSKGANLPLSVKLVDYGKKDRYIKMKMAGDSDSWGGETSTDTGKFRKPREIRATTDYGIVSHGWWSGEHRNGAHKNTPIRANEWMDAEIPLMLTDTWIDKGHRLGVVIHLNDYYQTEPLDDVGTVTLDPEHLFLSGRFSAIGDLFPDTRTAELSTK